MAKCKICKANEVPDGVSVCTDCFESLKHEPKVHLRLVHSDSSQWGLVVWEHNAIGGPPYDTSAEAVGVWGMYGDTKNLEYWVSLCRPIDAIHDMMTQLMAEVGDRNTKFVAAANTPRTVRKAQKPAETSFAALKARLAALKGGRHGNM